MRTAKIFIICAAILITAQLSFAPTGNKWIPSWTNQLGIKLEHQPEVDEDWEELSGTVEDPAPLREMGLSGVSKGMTFKILPMGNVDWTVTIKGKTIQPSKVKIEFPEEGFSLKLVPEKNEKGEAVLKPIKE